MSDQPIQSPRSSPSLSPAHRKDKAHASPDLNALVNREAASGSQSSQPREQRRSESVVDLGDSIRANEILVAEPKPKDAHDAAAPAKNIKDRKARLLDAKGEPLKGLARFKAYLGIFRDWVKGLFTSNPNRKAKAEKNQEAPKLKGNQKSHRSSLQPPPASNTNADKIYALSAHKQQQVNEKLVSQENGMTDEQEKLWDKHIGGINKILGEHEEGKELSKNELFSLKGHFLAFDKKLLGGDGKDVKNLFKEFEGKQQGKIKQDVPVAVLAQQLPHQEKIPSLPPFTPQDQLVEYNSRYNQPRGQQSQADLSPIPQPINKPNAIRHGPVQKEMREAEINAQQIHANQKLKNIYNISLQEQNRVYSGATKILYSMVLISISKSNPEGAWQQKESDSYEQQITRLNHAFEGLATGNIVMNPEVAGGIIDSVRTIDDLSGYPPNEFYFEYTMNMVREKYPQQRPQVPLQTAPQSSTSPQQVSSPESVARKPQVELVDLDFDRQQAKADSLYESLQTLYSLAQRKTSTAGANYNQLSPELQGNYNTRLATLNSLFERFSNGMPMKMGTAQFIVNSLREIDDIVGTQDESSFETVKQILSDEQQAVERIGQLKLVGQPDHSLQLYDSLQSDASLRDDYSIEPQPLRFGQAQGASASQRIELKDFNEAEMKFLPDNVVALYYLASDTVSKYGDRYQELGAIKQATYNESIEEFNILLNSKRSDRTQLTQDQIQFAINIFKNLAGMVGETLQNEPYRIYAQINGPRFPEQQEVKQNVPYSQSQIEGLEEQTKVLYNLFIKRLADSNPQFDALSPEKQDSYNRCIDVLNDIFAYAIDNNNLNQKSIAEARETLNVMEHLFFGVKPAPAPAQASVPVQPPGLEQPQAVPPSSPVAPQPQVEPMDFNEAMRRFLPHNVQALYFVVSDLASEYGAQYGNLRPEQQTFYNQSIKYFNTLLSANRSERTSLTPQEAQQVQNTFKQLDQVFGEDNHRAYEQIKASNLPEPREVTQGVNYTNAQIATLNQEAQTLYSLFDARLKNSNLNFHDLSPEKKASYNSCVDTLNDAFDYAMRTDQTLDGGRKEEVQETLRVMDRVFTKYQYDDIDNVDSSQYQPVSQYLNQPK